MFKKILSRIEKFDSIILMPHKKPDGDSLGSSFGLKYGLEELYPDKKFYIVGHHISYSKWMGDFDTVDDETYQNSLVICLDINHKYRIYDERIQLSQFIIQIDHHLDYEGFGDLVWVDPTRSATCTMITEFFYNNDATIPKKAAECLFSGIVTDTSRFRSKQVDGKTHRMIGYLLDQGVDRQYVYNQFYLRSLPMLELEKHVLTNYVTTPNGFIYITLNLEEIDRIGCTIDQAFDSIMKLEDIIAYPIWGAFYEDDLGIHGHIRSRGPKILDTVIKHGGRGHDTNTYIDFKQWYEIIPVVEDLDGLVRGYEAIK